MSALYPPEWVSILPDVASEDVGGTVIFATDEWFAPASMLLQSHEPVWKEHDFTPFGKWMDGWESRRRRTEGHDWCIIQLGLPARVRGVLLNTAYFTGNQVPHCSILGADVVPEAALGLLEGLRTTGRMGTCASAEQIAAAEQALSTHRWHEVVSEHPLKPGYPETKLHYFKSEWPQPVTHLRLNYFPDGGVARLRVFGEVLPPLILSTPSMPEVDMLAVENGAVALAWSNDHYGLPRNLLLPRRAPNMGNGWETARNPNRPKVLKRGLDGEIVFVGRDWAVFKLAARAELVRALVDTSHFKGNYPESAIVEGVDAPELSCMDVIEQRQVFIEAPGALLKGGSVKTDWKQLLARTKMEPDSERFFDLSSTGPVTHVRLTVLPDGGISRLRLFGRAVISG